MLRPDLNDREELQWLEDMEVDDTEGLEILKGVQHILERLPPNRWAVVTSATLRLALSRMRHGGIPIPQHIVTADKVSKGKPDPEPYLLGAKVLGLRPEDCLVIEDTASGATAGHAAKCKVLATLFSHSLESLSAADWVVQSLDNVHVSVVGNAIEVEFEPITRPVPRDVYAG
jgi:sugar-phosphatase